MTETTQEAAPKRRRKPKNQNVAVMNQLCGLLDQRTAIINQLRVARMTVGQLEAQLQSLAQEVQWRSSVLGISDNGVDNVIQGSPVSAPIYSGQQFDPAKLTTPIFVQPPQPQIQKDGVNRAFADLRSLS